MQISSVIPFWNTRTVRYKFDYFLAHGLKWCGRKFEMHTLTLNKILIYPGLINYHYRVKNRSLYEWVTNISRYVVDQFMVIMMARIATAKYFASKTVSPPFKCHQKSVRLPSDNTRNVLALLLSEHQKSACPPLQCATLLSSRFPILPEWFLLLIMDNLKRGKIFSMILYQNKS